MPRSTPMILLLASLALPAAASAGGSGEEHATRRSNRDSYVLSVGNTMTSDNVSVDDDERMHERRSGNYLWFRRDGKAWMVTDRATLQQAEALFAPLRALEPDQEKLQSRRQALDEEEQELGRQEDAIDRLVDLASGDDEDDDDDEGSVRAAAASEADLEALHARLRDLQARQRELASRERELDEVERSLDAREDAIEHEAEAKLWTLIDGTIKSGVARPD